MASPKNFEALMVPEPAGCAALGVRRRTSSGTRIERMASGYATEAEAHQWASAQLDKHLAGRAEARAKTTERRRRQRECVEAELTMSLRELAEIDPHSSTLRYLIDLLPQEAAFGAWKDDDNERRTYAIANQSVGRRWSAHPANALSGTLDEISEWITAQALANARWLASTTAGGI